MIKTNITYQEWCIQVLKNIIENDKSKGADFDGAFKNEIKSNLIEHYANTYYIKNTKDEKKSNWVNIWSAFYKTKYKNQNCQYYSPFLMSENAWISIKNRIKASTDSSKKFDDYLKKEKENNINLHWEHITPNSVVFKRFKEKAKNHVIKIEEIFKGHKLVIITKEELKFLDGEKQTFEKDGKRCKDNGTAEERLQHLKDKECKFGLIKNEKWEHCLDNEITDYLNDTKQNIIEIK